MMSAVMVYDGKKNSMIVMVGGVVVSSSSVGA